MFKKLKALFISRHEPRTVPRVDLPAPSFQIPQAAPFPPREKVELPEKRSERFTTDEGAERDELEDVTPAPQDDLEITKETSSVIEDATQVTGDRPETTEIESQPNPQPDDSPFTQIASSVAAEVSQPEESTPAPAVVKDVSWPPAPTSADKPLIAATPPPAPVSVPVVVKEMTSPTAQPKHPVPTPATAVTPAADRSAPASPSSYASAQSRPRRKTSLPASKNTSRIGPTPEQLCNISPSMTPEQIRQRLAFLYKRYNRASSSLNAGLRTEAEAALDAIVAVREKYFGPV